MSYFGNPTSLFDFVCKVREQEFVEMDFLMAVRRHISDISDVRKEGRLEFQTIGSGRFRIAWCARCTDFLSPHWLPLHF